MEGGAEGGGVSVCPKAETDSGSAEALLEKKKHKTSDEPEFVFDAATEYRV